MNALSWLIYAADVAGTAKTVALAGVALAVPAAFAAGFIRDAVDREEWDGRKRDNRVYPSLYPNPPEGPRPGISFPLRRFVKPSIVVLVASLVVLVATPTANTIYAIAASEMGERALETPTASKAVAALNAWLDRQIKAPAQ